MQPVSGARKLINKNKLDEAQRPTGRAANEIIPEICIITRK